MSKIARYPQAVAIVGQSRTTIHEKLNPRSPYYDPSFPKPVKLGARSVGFVVDELEFWVASRQRAA